MTFVLKISEGTIMSGNWIKRQGSSGHMTLDDAENDNDSNDKGVITGIKVSNMAQSFWQFVMTKKYILDSVFECSKTLQQLA
jgi:hypothetical protein